MNVRFLKPEERDDLKEFVLKHPYGTIEQTWAWGELQTTISGRIAFYVLGVFEGNVLKASMLLIRQHMGLKKYWLWCPGGPLLPEKKRSEHWKLLKAKVDELAKKEGDLFLRVEPNVPEEEEWPVGGRRTKERYLPENTLILDLSLSEEKLRAQMGQKGRYHIKKAEKAGVYVLKSDTTDFEEFWEVMMDTAKRDGFHVHGREFYEQFLDVLEGDAHLYVAKVEHELIAGMLLVHFGDQCTYYFGASSSRHKSSYAPYALQWFAIQEAKKRGCRTYDFLGIAPKGAQLHPLKGVTQFKTRFGGKRLNYHKASVFVYRPFWWLLSRFAKWIF